MSGTSTQSNGFICGAWKFRAQGPIMNYAQPFIRARYVCRCDLPEGHDGDHVDSVVGVNWSGLNPIEVAKELAAKPSLETDKDAPLPAPAGEAKLLAPRGRTPQWMLMFEDAEMGRNFYDTEAEARAAYEQYNDRWNMTLFSPMYAKPSVETDKDALAKEEKAHEQALQERDDAEDAASFDGCPQVGTGGWHSDRFYEGQQCLFCGEFPFLVSTPDPNETTKPEAMASDGRYTVSVPKSVRDTLSLKAAILKGWALGLSDLAKEAKRDAEEHLRLCKSAYDTNIATLQRNHEVDRNEWQRASKEAKRDGILEGLEMAVSIANKFINPAVAAQDSTARGIGVCIRAKANEVDSEEP